MSPVAVEAARVPGVKWLGSAVVESVSKSARTATLHTTAGLKDYPDLAELNATFIVMPAHEFKANNVQHVVGNSVEEFVNSFDGQPSPYTQPIDAYVMARGCG